jgi:hypothetical protein
LNRLKAYDKSKQNNRQSNWWISQSKSEYEAMNLSKERKKWKFHIQSIFDRMENTLFFQKNSSYLRRPNIDKSLLTNNIDPIREVTLQQLLTRIDEIETWIDFSEGMGEQITRGSSFGKIPEDGFVESSFLTSVIFSKLNIFRRITLSRVTFMVMNRYRIKEVQGSKSLFLSGWSKWGIDAYPWRRFGPFWKMNAASSDDTVISIYLTWKILFNPKEGSHQLTHNLLHMTLKNKRIQEI